MPRFARGYHMRGLVQGDLGAREEALADLGRAIELDGKEWSTYYTRASLLRSKQDHAGALADLNIALERKPGEAKALLLRALVMADKGEYAEARSDINKVIASGRNTSGAYYARAAVAYEEQRYDAAADDVDRALAGRDAFPAAQALMGRIMEARGDTAAAKERYHKALDLPVADLEARAGRQMAAARLKALGDTADVALNQRRPEVGCKRFLPATGTIINTACAE
jgi:tetratricopeptide (TPR) repeat protein